MASPYALDFSPISDAIQSNVRNRLAQDQLGMQQERLGFERELHPLQMQAQRQNLEKGSLETQALKAQADRVRSQRILQFLGENYETLPPEQKAA